MKKKKVKRNGESFYEYRNFSTMGFFRVSLPLPGNGKPRGILILSASFSIVPLPSHDLPPPETYTYTYHLLCFKHHEIIVFDHTSFTEASSNKL